MMKVTSFVILYLLTKAMSIDKHDVYKMKVVSGNTHIMNCSVDSYFNTVGVPLWKFNGGVILAQDVRPIDFRNVDGKVVNKTFAYLRIIQFSPMNAGNYTCIVGKDPMATYLLDIRDPTVYILCQGTTCNHSEDVSVRSTYIFECYSDQIPPNDNYTWLINGIDVSNKSKSGNISTTIRSTIVNVMSSIIEVKISESHENVSCLLGNISKTVKINVTNTNTIQIVISCTVLGVVCFSAIISTLIYCKTPLQLSHCMRRDRLASNNLSRAVSSSTLEGDTVSIYETLSEYDNVTNDYDVVMSSAIRWESVELLSELQGSHVIQQWDGVLTLQKKKTQNVLISFLKSDASTESKCLWRCCVELKISFPESENILKTFGFCKHEGILYLIQDHYEMNTLEFCLNNEHNNYSLPNAVVSGGRQPNYAMDVINAMSFLSRMGCSHPGLCAKRILVNNIGVCKLYDFCLIKDATKILPLYFRENTESEWTLPPESTRFDDYRPASDVWGIGIVLWEIYFGDMETLRTVVSLRDTEMQNKITTLCNDSDFPLERCKVLKMCLRKKFENRPSIDGIRGVLGGSGSTYEVNELKNKNFIEADR